VSTFDKTLADRIIAGDYEEDCWVKIVEYTNKWGGTSYGCIRKGQDLDSYRETAYVINPRVYWERPRK
jgi:hypothetical protein